jgi:uncharacterized membrane protein YcaP (DUF421 family)
MSSSTSSANGTTIVSGPNPIQTSDFFVSAGILHPIVIGSIAVLTLFAYLRLGSNRSIAPITIFDWLINVALGSTLAGIVNGNSLTRGLLALGTMLGFQYLTSMLATRFSHRLGWLFQSPPLVIAFRGEMLRKVMLDHRISITDFNASLRGHGLLNVCQIECAIIEPNGTISIFSTKDLQEAEVEPEVLMAVPAYRALCEKARDGEKGTKKGEASEGMNDAADCNC